MNSARQLCLGIGLLLGTSLATAKEVTIQVQMVSYEGEKTYSALYLVNPSGRYEQTLWVSGDEEKYYADGLSRWWKYLSRQPEPQPLDGLTGATIGSGDRYQVTSELDERFIDSGYALRVETAVEDREYYRLDAEVPLASQYHRKKVDGHGWVRYLRFNWQ